MKCNVWKPCSDQRWQDKLLFLIWRFFEQSSFVNIYLLSYWPTIHNLISKICRKFQVFSSHFFKVYELLDEQRAKIVQSENISTPIYVECHRMYQSKVCVQEFSYFVSGQAGLDIQLEKSEYYSPVWKKVCCRWLNTTSYIQFFFERLIWTNGLAVKVSRCEFGYLGLIPNECWNALQRLGHFAWHWTRQCTDTRAFYIAALSIIFLSWISSVATSRWQSGKS